MGLLPGAMLSKYRILEPIGAGGMGIVYRAHDERLDRDVALKLLPAGAFADESARKRFRKEALALSRLNHPNIATVHDFDRVDETDFLVMEYVAGSTLPERLAAGPLPEREIARLGAQMAEGLAAAHREGIVHRDMKPGNIRLTPDGRLKILDFGLAKLIRPLDPSAETATASGSHGVAGTLPYMAPEQVLGEELDARCDIYGGGAALYEMATGVRPFAQDISSRLTDAILHDTPISPRSRNPRLSADLERIILKCLEKDPDRRYQSARELYVDLERLRSPTQAAPAGARRSAWRPLRPAVLGLAVLAVVAAVASAAIFGSRLWKRSDRGGKAAGKQPTIAVLYFDDFGATGEGQNLAAGVTEDVTTALSQVPGLQVVSRSAMERYRNTDVDPRRVGRDLGVDYVLEGSIRLAGSKLRTTAQLVRTTDALHVWAGKFDGTLADIFAVQDSIATHIASELKSTVGTPELFSISKHWTENARAYAYYLSGRETFRDGARLEAMAEARMWYEKAVALDPDYAPALAGLAAVIVREWGLGYWPHDGLSRALDLVHRAQKLDPSLAHPWRVEAGIWSTRGDRRRWSEALQRAMKANPTDPENYVAMAGFNLASGQRERAARLYRKAAEIDPHWVSAYAGQSAMYRQTGTPANGEKLVAAGLRLLPGEPRLLLEHAENLLAQGDQNGATRTFRDVLRTRPDYLSAHTRLGSILRGSGRVHEADSVFAAVLRRWPDNPRVLDWYGFEERLRGRYAASDSACRRAIQLSPDFYFPRRNLVHLESAQNRQARAESLFLSILKRWPNEATACEDLARFYFDRRRYRSAEQWALRAIQNCPDRRSAYSQLAWARLNQGSFPGSIQAFQKAIALRPDDAEPYRDLSVAFDAAGRHKEALSAAEKAVELRPNYLKGWLAVGNAHANLGRIHPAAAAYERALEIDSTSAGAYNNLANCYVSEGRYERALEIYRRATRLDPRNTAAWVNIAELARIYLRDDRLVREAALETIELAPGSMHAAIAYLELGVIEQDRGNAAGSRNLFLQGLAIVEPLLRENPKSSGIIGTAGHLYARSGERGKALKLAALLAETQRGSQLSLYDAACIASLAGDRDRAFELLVQAVHAGFEDRDLMTRDPDLDGTRKDPRFKQLLASLP